LKAAVQITPSDYRKLSDEELIRRYAELHEKSPAIHLYERYAYILYGVFLKHNKDSAAAKRQVEEAYLQMLQYFSTSKIKAFKPWLMQFFKNHFSKGGKTVNEGYGLPDGTDYPTLPDTGLQKAMASLPTDERRCMELFYTDKKTYEEIAMDTGFAVPKVQQLLKAGNQDIRAFIKTNYPTNL
jgi:RNA polymerase sigma-70 factor (ECF subfamily)